MRQSSRLAVAAILFSPLLGAHWAAAGTTNITVTPTEQTGTGYGASADTGGGIAVGDTTTGAPGWGSSSFISVGINTEFDIVPSQIPALGAINISDLKSISYNTKNNSNTSEDWDIRIYTNKTSAHASFYENRFETPNPLAPNSNWTTWSTDNSVAVTNVHNWTGSNTAVNTSANGLNDLDANYGSQSIEYVAFISGFSGQQTAINDNLDGITFTLNNGNVVRFDLVPEPASISVLGLGCSGLLARRRRA